VLLQLCTVVTASLLCLQIQREKHNCNLIKQKRKRKTRALWSRKWLMRRDEGRGAANFVFNELMIEDYSGFKNYTRMTTSTFDILLNKVAPLIKKQDTTFRQCIPMN